MQKKVSAAVRAFGRAHKAGLALLGGGVAALGVFWAARRSAVAMQWWVEYVSMPVKRFVSALVEPLPFSFCELAATAAILICLVRLVQRIVRAMHRKQAGFAAWVLHVGTAAVWIYAGVCALWGTQYYAPSFAAQANMQAPALSVEQLAATTVWFGEQVNAAADTVPRDETGLFAVSKEKILLNTGHVYDGIVAEYPFLAGPHRSPKPAFYSKLMSAAGFTGYLCPLFGESTLNVDCPAVFLPATIAHEFSHQRGVAAEQEANFVAIRASTTCGDAAYEYSGWLMGYLYLSNAWYSADPQAASENYRTLCDAARTDLAAPPSAMALAPYWLRPTPWPYPRVVMTNCPPRQAMAKQVLRKSRALRTSSPLTIWPHSSSVRTYPALSQVEAPTQLSGESLGVRPNSSSAVRTCSALY